MNFIPFNHIDITAIIADRLQVIEGKTVLYIPMDSGSDRRRKNLIILLTPVHGAFRFFGIGAFLNDQRADLLFMTDPMSSWYQEDDSGEAFFRVLNHFCSQYLPENVMIFGHSMAGHGALFHGVRLNINVMATNPQADRKSIEDHGWLVLQRRLQRMNRFIDLDEWFSKEYRNSVIYLVHGQDPMDLGSIANIQRFQPIRAKIVVQTEDDASHNFFYTRDDLTQYLYQAYDLLKVLRIAMATGNEETAVSSMTYLAQESPRPSPLMPENRSEVRWFNRMDHQNPGAETTFVDCGIYDKQGNIRGLRCRYDDDDVWTALSPSLSLSDNLLWNSDFSKWSQGKGPFMNHRSLTADGWRLQIRLDPHCFVEPDGEKGVRVAVKPSLSNKTSLIQVISSTDARLTEQMSDRIVTVCADFWVEQGPVFLEIAIYDADGIGRKQRMKTTKTRQWERVVVYHRTPANVQAVHVALVFSGGKVEDLVRVRNVFAVLGYFPMGFSIVPIPAD